MYPRNTPEPDMIIHHSNYLSVLTYIWKISLLKYFIVPVDYKIKYYKIFSTLKIQKCTK